MDRLKDADGAPSMKLLTDTHAQEELWEVRKAGLGATANVPTMPRSHTGWEDAAVPPEKVGPYLRDFRKLLDDFGYDCSIYGHFGDGCIHCRIDFDFVDQRGVDHFMDFLDKASDLVLSYGGSLSGEHGDGQSRAAFLEKKYGADLVEAFRRFKRIWDPDWKMNPNKVVDPFSPDEYLREGPNHQPWSPRVRMEFQEDDGDFVNAAARCVGVGECRKHDHGDMCPSYMATREEAYSTRGRARLLFEMTEGSVIADGWRSQAVHDALDLCLACKACKGECPVHVDMADYKAEFMHHYYKGRLRPRVAYSMGLIWWWSRLASTMPGLANWATQGPLSGLAKSVGGFAPQRTIPRFASPNFRNWFEKRSRSGRARTDGEPVILWPDTFNTYFTPKPLIAAVEVLEKAGYRVIIPERPLCCGRPLYSFGFLQEAGRLWERNVETLRPAIRHSVPIVGLEPTCVAAFKDELIRMRPHDRDAQRLSRQVRHFSDFLADEAKSYEPPKRSGGAVYHAHCHHRAILNTDPEIDLLKRMGFDVDVLDDGCCGMAGDYGFRTETYDISMTLAERAFLPAVREAGEKVVVTDGFSCREQAFEATGRMPLTMPELLNGD
jgi:Fe-S oxidoreductase